MSEKKRDKLQVIYDILRAIKDHDGSIKPTHILYKSNLSHKMMAEYMKELTEKEFIVQTTHKGRKSYKLEQKGFDFINRYKSIVEFMDSFGLS